ncbi:MAG: hypothetical protein D6732_02820, partial [Methanobacteriota archaeon]
GGSKVSQGSDEWVSFFDELSKKLYQMRGRQEGLVKILNQVRERCSLTVRDDIQSLGVMDPFTFVSGIMSCRGKRGRMLEEVRKILEIEANAPRNFDGIPTSNPLKSRFFRSSEEVDLLWKLHEQAWKDEITPTTWKNILARKDIGIGLLSQGLFWFFPDRYLPFNSKVRKFLLDGGLGDNLRRLAKELKENEGDYDRYVALLDACKEAGKTFMEISYEAEKAERKKGDDRNGKDSSRLAKTAAKAEGNGRDDRDDHSQDSGACSLNLILYGPPGTGKTYNTIIRAVEICEGKCPASYEEAKEAFRRLRREGRIEFVTFHQSFGYEEFIEGIRAEADAGQVHYEVRDGIFKQLAVRALYKAFATQDDGWEPTFFEVYGNLVDIVKRHLGDNNGYILNTKTGKRVIIRSISDRENLHCFHEGSEIRHTVGRGRLQRLFEKYKSSEDLDKVADISEAFKQEIGGANFTVYWAVL